MYKSLEEICREAKRRNKEFWELILEDDCEERQVERGSSFAAMLGMYQAMKEADASYEAERYSSSKLVGSDGAKLHEAVKNKQTICGDFLGTVMEKAVKMGESNACMKRIVAAPTAGACGVVPAVFLSMQEAYGYTDEKMVQALYVAAGIGGVIASRAFIAGAQGGCQAEIGSASSMAAGGAVFLRGGGEEAIVHAAAMAMKNLLGLACDPVAGLVGAVNALSSADMALAGIRSKIPPDEVIDAMRSVGLELPSCIRETGMGGLAATPTGIRIREEISGRTEK